VQDQRLIIGSAANGPGRRGGAGGPGRAGGHGGQDADRGEMRAGHPPPRDAVPVLDQRLGIVGVAGAADCPGLAGGKGRPRPPGCRWRRAKPLGSAEPPGSAARSGLQRPRRAWCTSTWPPSRPAAGQSEPGHRVPQPAHRAHQPPRSCTPDCGRHYIPRRAAEALRSRPGFGSAPLLAPLSPEG